SRRPAMVVGAELDRAGAWDEAIRLAESCHARVFVAPMSSRCSFPEDHSLFAGFLPAMREKIVQLLEGHDLVFVAGAPAFTYHVEGSGPYLPPGATLYQLIDDPMTASWTPQGSAIVGNIRLGLQDLLTQMAQQPPATRLQPARREP
ncbi:benzoylformate decarboxylase, partial [Herbaspirillum frisingense]